MYVPNYTFLQVCHRADVSSHHRKRAACEAPRGRVESATMPRFNLTARERRAKRSVGAPLMAVATAAACGVLVFLSSPERTVAEADAGMDGRRLSSLGPFSTECTPEIADRGAWYAILMFVATIYVSAVGGSIHIETPESPPHASERATLGARPAARGQARARGDATTTT